MSRQPFVSVVTPVYNGGKFLGECIESALCQTHENFEYIILDNCSTDDTGRIARHYARQDGRIRLFNNDETLWVIDNWNRALEKLSPDSQYCKILHADDTMYPECLEKMVRLASRHPSVGIVGSLRLRGERVECEGLPADREVFSGTEVGRLFLRQEVFAFAPTSGLVRSDLVRARRPFYPPAYLHADLAAYFALLDKHDFGFVNEVLAFSRTHEDSITTTVAQRKQTILKDWLLMLQEYGPRFFSPEELSELEREFLRRYYRVLVRGFVTRRGREFHDYHRAGLKQADRLPSARDLCVAATAELAASAAHPGKLYRHLRAMVRR